MSPRVLRHMLRTIKLIQPVKQYLPLLARTSILPATRNFSNFKLLLISGQQIPLVAPKLKSGVLSNYNTHYNYYSTRSSIPELPAKLVDYNEVSALSNNPPQNLLIVDAREPNEFKLGHIPNAVNIPYRSMPGALGLPPAEFHTTLGFPKPSFDKTLLFYCQGGVRSTHAEQLAKTFGYENRMNYKGSYDDWLARHTK